MIGFTLLIQLFSDSVVMAQYRIPDPDELIECPYDRVHMVRAKRFQYHLMKCRNVSIFQPCHENLSLGFPTRCDTNWAVQQEKIARVLKFRI